MNPDNSPLVSIVGSQIRVQAENVAEAKLALKELRLRKKEYTLERKEILQEQRQLRAAYTDQTRRQGSMVRGGGFIGRLIRSGQRGARDAAKQQLARALAPLESQRNDIDAMIQAIEKAMIQIEQYIVRNS